MVRRRAPRVSVASEQHGSSGLTDRAARNISIAVVERRLLTRQCLTLWLQADRSQFEITPVARVSEMVEDHRLVADVDLILFSIGGARMSSPDVRCDIERLVRHWDHVPVVLLADHEESDDIVEAIQRGVRGYIPTSLDLVGATEALRFIWAGGTFVPASALVRLVQDQRREPHQDLPQADNDLFDRLTPREREVLVRLRQGKPNKIIARELQITESTVKVFVCRILSKLHASNRTELVYLTQAFAAVPTDA